MIPLSLTLAATALALAVSAYPLVLDHPDEVARTRAWIAAERAAATVRQAALSAPTKSAPAAVTDPVAPAEIAPATAISDPFATRRPAAPAVALSSAQAQGRTAPADDEARASALPAALPPAPMLHLLGSLEQDGHWMALLQVDGTTYRLSAGDTLPGGAGRLVAIHEDRVEIVAEGQHRQLHLAPAASAAAPPQRYLPDFRERHHRRDRRARRLIRPGEAA